MRAAGQNRLVVIAAACFIVSMLLVVIPIDTVPIDTAIAIRFFSAGVLTGTAIFLIALSQWRRFK